MVLGSIITLLARFVFRRLRLCLSGDYGKLGTRCVCVFMCVCVCVCLSLCRHVPLSL